MDTHFGKTGNLDIDSILEKINFEKFGDHVENELEKMNALNIINVGKSGVGKSTIINAVFSKDLAKTGIGKPVTQHCQAYTIPDSPITIYDSKGLETGLASEGILKEIYDRIKTQNSSSDPKEYIHICWYCVLDGGNRLEEYEVETIKKIQQTIPVVIVITQSVGGKGTNDLISKIEEDFSDNSIDIIPIMAVPKIEESDFGQTNIKSHGLNKLVERSYELLPEAVKKTFAAYQTASLEQKVKSAFTAVKVYSRAVALAAFQLLPIADVPIMVAVQVAMMEKITACFGLKPSSFNFKTIISGLGGDVTFVAALVRMTLASLLKFIPGIGTVVGGFINATTAGAITYAIGSTYIKVLSSIVKDNGKIDKEEIIAVLNEATKDLNMDEMKKEWEKEINSYSESERKQILDEAKQILDEVEKDIIKK